MAANNNSIDNNDPVIKFEEVTLLTELGEGHFGKVYKGTCRGSSVAVKLLKLNGAEAELRQSFAAEVKNMAKKQGPKHICRFVGACFEEGREMLLTEYYEKGDLQRVLIDSKKPLSLLEKARYCMDMARGVRWLHEGDPKMVHRDLKPQNLLLDNDGRIVVCDFGLGQLMPEKYRMRDLGRAQGTPVYMAPEVMSSQPFDTPSDIYALGVVMWQIFTRERPFPNYSFSDAESVELYRNDVCERGFRPPIPSERKIKSRVCQLDGVQVLPEDLVQLITWCWAHDPSGRPTIAAVTERLENIVLNLSIPDVAGDQSSARRFWIENWTIERFHVPRSEFLDCIMKLGFREDPSQLRKLLEMFLSEIGSADEVSIEHLSKLVNFFGPIDGDLLTRFFEIASQPWFHGLCPEHQALLQYHPALTFLVRLSGTAANAFTLVFNQNGQQIHQRILFEFHPDVVYRTITANHLEWTSLRQFIASAQLGYPAPGSKFAGALTEKTKIYID